MDIGVGRHMKKSFAQLRAMSEEQLMKEIDSWAGWEHARVEYYLNELVRRRHDELTQAMVRYTRWIVAMTLIMTLTTSLNLAVAAIIAYLAV